MSCLERQHGSHEASMRHPSNLDTFMDETDREVMSLTDRAFKSLCIGDEAIYNDSELFPSPVNCHKPLAEEIPKKPQENSTLHAKKHGAHRPNGVYTTPWQTNKSTSKVSSIFAAFVAKKNNDAKMRNGDSWDKSALLSIQTELSELSSDYQNHRLDEHKSHRKPSEKRTGHKSAQDLCNSSGKSSKNQHSKSTKLRKLNSRNFFLHSEFSPFQSWGDLNRFGLENVEMFPCTSPAGLYDSLLYREQNNLNRLHVPEPNKRGTSQSTSPQEPHHKPKPDLSPCAAQTQKTGPPVAENHSELNFPKLPDIQMETLQSQVLVTSSGSFPRCQSEGDLYAPWRKSRSRAKGVVQPLISSPACERSNTGEEWAKQNKKEVRTVEETVGINSTPFNISQLLTPVIPSRQGTGTSEILQSLHSPAALDISALHETDIRPSPDIKREGYKSKASSLLFNLKDNRKRVKATYSPPKFKAVDAADQNKLSPLIEQDATKNALENAEITTTAQNPIMDPTSPEAADLQSPQSSSHINSTLLDDFLGLSLLQDGNRGSPSSKSKKNHSAKATYPSLNLYPKSSPVELSTKPILVDVAGSHSTVHKSAEQKLSREPEKYKKELQRVHHFTKPEINSAKLRHAETAVTAMTDTSNVAALKETYHPNVSQKPNSQKDAVTLVSSRNQEKVNTEGRFKAEEKPLIYNECHRKETNSKHLFSARQNNYIKNQRYANVDDNNDADDNDEDDDEDECEDRQRNVILAGTDEPRKRELNVYVHKNKGKVQEYMDEPLITETFTKDNFIKNAHSKPGTCIEQGIVKNDASSMKGNTSAKIALFNLKDQPFNAVPSSKKKNIVKDKYELATVALEKRIAEREQRKKLGNRQNGQDLAINRDLIQEHTVVSNQQVASGSVSPHKGGQKAISDFTPTSQNVQHMSDMSDIDTARDEYHVPEVKLAKPYKQEGAAKHSPSRLIYSDRDRADRHSPQGDTSKSMSMANVPELKEMVCMNNNRSLDLESSVVQDYDNKLIRDESSGQNKKASYTPEAPLRRERANSYSEDKDVGGRQRKEDVGNVERSVIERECLSTDDNKSNLPKNKVKGHVSSLTEKFNREQVLSSLNTQEGLRQGDNRMAYPENDLLKLKAISPKDVMVFTEAEETEADNKELPKKDSKLDMGNEECLGEEIADKQHSESPDKDITRHQESKKDMIMTENEFVSDVFRKTGNQNKSQYHCDSSVQFEKADEPDGRSEETPTLNLLNTKNASVHTLTCYDVLNQAESPPLVNEIQLQQVNPLSKLPEDSSCSPKSEEFYSVNNGEEQKYENSDAMDSFSNSTSENKQHETDMAVDPPKDIKGGWVRSLIDSARNLTPTCQSNASSPTLGKPTLFKVKDNTFSTSPVTKTVRPILHKTVAGVTHPWSPRGSLSGSERGEEDPDLFKDFVQSPPLSFTPVRFTQPNQSSIQDVPPSSSQSTADQERKTLLDSSTVPEDEQWQVAINALSDEIESCETSAGDTLEEFAFNTTTIDSLQDSKTLIERSESACSGIENQLQGKPPVVPPKSEKALRRAMKLTTKRIQKAEAKSKVSERGRSSETGSSQKRERRHHSSDKVLSDRSYQQDHSTDIGESNQSTGENSEISLSKIHATQHHKPNNYRKENNSERKLQHRCCSSQITMDMEAESNVAEKQNANQSQHKDKLETQNITADYERLGRTSEKCPPHKPYRRAHSLDRFSSGKLEHRLLSAEEPDSKSNAVTLAKVANGQTTPLRQNSMEHTYCSPANNIVPQSFPMTQRKLLQDLDSGQYFVVDMPVQVKTKTFFDPETGRYVQLPVQSLDGSVPRAQSVEVVNAPPLMLYHGFVPVPVSSLP